MYTIFTDWVYLVSGKELCPLFINWVDNYETCMIFFIWNRNTLSCIWYGDLKMKFEIASRNLYKCLFFFAVSYGLKKIIIMQNLGVSIVRLAPLFEHAERYYDRILVPQPDPLEMSLMDRSPLGEPLVSTTFLHCLFAETLLENLYKAKNFKSI